MIFDQPSLNSVDSLTTTPLNPSVSPTVLPGLNDGLEIGQPTLFAAAASSSLPPLEISPNDLNGARNLGDSNGRLGSPSARIRGTIGGPDGNGRDRQDFYKFTGGGTITVALTGINRDVDIQLLDSTGVEVARSTASGATNEVINLSNLSSDTYYVRVYEENPDETPYDIQASNNTVPDLLVAERRINNLSGTQNFSGGISDRDTSDIYQFSLNATSNVSMLLNGLADNGLTAGLDIGVRVIRDRNNDGVITRNEVILDSTDLNDPTQPLNFAGLGSGTYFVQVYQNGSGNISRYNLRLTATAGAGVAPEPNNSLAQAFNIGPLNGSRGFTGTISNRGINPNSVDYYQFNLSSNNSSNGNSTLNLNLSGLSANVDVRLLDSNGTILQSSLNAGNASETIQRSLPSGVYYVEVFADINNPVITNYNLNLSA